MARKKNPNDPMPDRLKRNSGFVSVKTTTISLYQGDVSILERLADHYGCSKSEVIRTALRNLEVVVANGAAA